VGYSGLLPDANSFILFLDHSLNPFPYAAIGAILEGLFQ
jgi:hypothetical protein